MPNRDEMVLEMGSDEIILAFSALRWSFPQTGEEEKKGTAAVDIMF